MIKVTDYMVAQLRESLDEADTLGAAIWGGVPNIKVQSVLEGRKRTLSSDLSKIISYLTELRSNVESLKMVDGEGEQS